jgi:hypothetical protein
LRTFFGKEVDWKVVLGSKQGDGRWTFRYYSDNRLTYCSAIWGAGFEPNSVEAADSLHSGDQIQLHGTLRSFTDDTLIVAGSTFEFLAPAGK